MKKVRWLHLTDLHAGMRVQGWLWPTYETQFLQDVMQLHERSGPWDFILFSGDMVRAGLPSEFDVFSQIIEKVLMAVRANGSDCKVVSLPGNHDLARPSDIDPHFVSLMQLASNSRLQEDFWSEDKAGNRSFVNKTFDAYSKWRGSMIDRGLHLEPEVDGYLAGDASYRVMGEAGSVNLVTLNSTWLQLQEGDFRGRLIVDPRQLLRVTNNDPDGWLGSADAAILSTHQGPDWLTAEANALWQSEIHLPNRFDLHAYGHMHRPTNKTYSFAGSGARREVLGASLFGMEAKGVGWERIQGYASYVLEVQENGRRLFCWPRLLQPMQSGEQKIKADNGYDLDESTGSYSIEYQRNIERGRAVSLTTSSEDPFVSPTKDLRFKVSNVEIVLPRDPGFEATRLAEQQQAESAWSEGARAFWLSSEWGMGTRPFIARVSDRVFGKTRRAFKLEMGGFTDKASFLEQVRVKYGTSFEEICDSIEQVGEAIVIFDDVTLSTTDATKAQATIRELESLILATKDYLPSGVFCIIIREYPKGASLPVVELRAFDEPDTRLYIQAHKTTELEQVDESLVTRIFKLTDGHPTRLETALRQLEVVSLDELTITNSDLALEASLTEVPEVLEGLLQTLTSEGEAGEKAFSLLSALSQFPGGERLETVKRFVEGQVFYPEHAAMLRDRNLIEAVTFNRMGDASSANSVRLLVVPRTVREGIRARLGTREKDSSDRRALELYFGTSWRSGLQNSAMATKFASNPLVGSYELLNANTILLRALIRSYDEDNSLDIEAVLRLITSFVTRQRYGGHYRNALALSEEVLLVMGDRNQSSVDYLKLERARCLRMLGRHADARDQFLSTDLTGATRATRQEVALGLAQSYRGAGDHKEAASEAQKALELNPKSMIGHHARILLAQMKPASAARTQELIELRNKASARKWFTLEGNVNIFLATGQDKKKKLSTLRAVIDNSQKHGDFYNKFRAIIDFMENRQADEPISLSDKLTLMSAYHFFHAERMADFFERVHKILWSVFEAEGDIQNLLSLFRHSSFIWRLSDNKGEEVIYLDRLRQRMDQIKKSNLARINRDRVYFLIRIQSVDS